MPTKLTRIEVLLTEAQIKDLMERFPDAPEAKAALYRAAGFDPPKHGGKREGAGMKPKGRKARGKAK
jgi:hypothetical protein